MATCPRVLIVNGYPPSSENATGLTLLSLFREWPPSALACLHLPGPAPEPGVCGLDMVVGDQNDAIGRLLPKLHAEAPRDPRSASPSTFSQSARLARGGFRLRSAARGHSVLELSRYRLPASILESIAAFKPDLIYSMLASNRLMALTLQLADLSGASIVPHFMDDWPSTLYRTSILRSALRARLDSLLFRILRSAPLRLVIGPDMAAEFQRRYGGHFEPFMNGVEVASLAYAPPSPARGRPVRLSYVGGLHLDRWKSLVDIGLALGRLEAKGMTAELTVYSTERFAAEAAMMAAACPTILLGGPLRPDEVPSVLRRSDILVHAESFGELTETFARWSISTKLPEYLGAGRPILAYGPRQLASVSYVHHLGAGIAVDVRDSDALVWALCRLVSSEPERIETGLRARQAALEFHDAARQRARLLALFQSVPRKGRPEHLDR